MSDVNVPSADDQLRIDIGDADGVGVLTVAGEIDLHTADRLREALYEIIGGTNTVVVDCRAITFLDSTGLGALIAGLKHAREAGGDIVLRSPSPIVSKLLSITRLDAVFEIVGP